MTGACDGCLRRGRLLARLAPRIAGLLDRPRRRPLGLLALSDDELSDAGAPRHGGELRAGLADFDARAERARLEAVGAGAACSHGSAYPAPLRELVDAPAVV
ncbi:MAG: hypothetical protein ACM3UV_05025, partial [Nocardioidaceae bacterium]